jgi:hypothetical protein
MNELENSTKRIFHVESFIMNLTLISSKLKPKSTKVTYCPIQTSNHWTVSSVNGILEMLMILSKSNKLTRLTISPVLMILETCTFLFKAGYASKLSLSSRVENIMELLL